MSRSVSLSVVTICVFVGLNAAFGFGVPTVWSAAMQYVTLHPELDGTADIARALNLVEPEISILGYDKETQESDGPDWDEIAKTVTTVVEHTSLWSLFK